MKQGKVGGVVAIVIVCSDGECGGSCINSEGSSMITDDDEFVSCEACGTQYTVPRKAFARKRIVTRQKQATF